MKYWIVTSKKLFWDNRTNWIACLESTSQVAGEEILSFLDFFPASKCVHQSHTFSTTCSSGLVFRKKEKGKGIWDKHILVFSWQKDLLTYHFRRDFRQEPTVPIRITEHRCLKLSGGEGTKPASPEILIRRDHWFPLWPLVSSLPWTSVTSPAKWRRQIMLFPTVTCYSTVIFIS